VQKPQAKIDGTGWCACIPMDRATTLGEHTLGPWFRSLPVSMLTQNPIAPFNFVLRLALAELLVPNLASRSFRAPLGVRYRRRRTSA